MLLLFVLAAFFQINAPWEWGHNGYNGAAFSQAARNALRHHILGQAQNWCANTPPPPEAIYTHHPLLIHLHIAAHFKLFGESLWAARLVPVLYSVGSLVLVFFMARRWWSDLSAGIATATFALLPITLIYANMIDHEQAGIFWSLAIFDGYLRYLEQLPEKRSWGLLLYIGLAIFMACQWDWPPYYLSFFIAIHLFALILRNWRQARRRLIFFGIGFSAWVLTNFIAFFLWIRSLRGSLEEMGGSFSKRSGSRSGMWSHTLGRLPDMIPTPILVLGVLWLVYFAVRAGRGQARRRDFIPIAFFLAQLLHTLVFQSAAYIHVYWFYWFAPFLAFAIGDLLADIIVGLGDLNRRYQWISGRLLWRVLAVLVLAATILMAVHSARLFMVFRLHGSSPYAFPGPERYRNAMGAWISEHVPREGAVVFHPDIEYRPMFVWYLDRPSIRSGPKNLPEDIHGHAIMAFVAPVGYSSDELKDVPSAVLMDEWRVYDLSGEGLIMTGEWSIHEEPLSLLQAYLRGPNEPLLQWQEQ